MNSKSYYPHIGSLLPFEAAVYAGHINALKMLFLSGCSCGVHSLENNHGLKAGVTCELKELLKEWNVHKNNAMPLQQRCRVVILNHLCPQADKKITELPLLPQLIKYLTIPELDDIMEIFNNTEQIDSYMIKCLSIQELDDIIRRNKKNNPHNNHYVK